MQWFWTNRFPFFIVVMLFASMLCGGCGDDDEKKTIQGLREENKVLQEKIAYLESKVQEIRHDYDVKLDGTKSEKVDVEFRLSQLRKSNDELLAARSLEERIVSHSNNTLLYSLFISILVNVVVIAWVAWDYYNNRRRIWHDASQFITAKVETYVDKGAANNE